MADKQGFVPLSLYLEPDIEKQVAAMAETHDFSKSAMGELLIKKGLGVLGDYELEQIFKAQIMLRKK